MGIFEKLVWAVVFGVLAISSARADGWTTNDTKREVAYLALHTMDWSQTRYIAKHPEYYEQNSHLGKHPTVAQVNAYFASMALAHIRVAYLLPADWRHGFQYVTIGVELGWVTHNASIGIKMDF